MPRSFAFLVFGLLGLAMATYSAASTTSAQPAPPPFTANTAAPALNSNMDKQETTVSAYLRGNGTKSGGGGGDSDNDDGDLTRLVGDTPVAQSGAGATLTGATTETMAGTGALAYESLGM